MTTTTSAKLATGTFMNRQDLWCPGSNQAPNVTGRSGRAQCPACRRPLSARGGKVKPHLAGDVKTLYCASCLGSIDVLKFHRYERRDFGTVVLHVECPDGGS